MTHVPAPTQILFLGDDESQRQQLEKETRQHIVAPEFEWKRLSRVARNPSLARGANAIVIAHAPADVDLRSLSEWSDENGVGVVHCGIHTTNLVTRVVERRPAPWLFDGAATCLPADQFSGDVMDLICLPDGRCVAMLADVSGHGIGPAIVASIIRVVCKKVAISAAIDTLGSDRLMANQFVERILVAANKRLLHSATQGRFATAFVAIVSPHSDSIHFATAGHTAFIVRDNGAFVRLESGNPPLGVDEDTTYSAGIAVTLAAGDVLLVVSDGVAESHKDVHQPFGIDSAIWLVHRDRQLASEVIANNLVMAADRVSTGCKYKDDATALIVKAPRHTTMSMLPLPIISTPAVMPPSSSPRS